MLKSRADVFERRLFADLDDVVDSGPADVADTELAEPAADTAVEAEDPIIAELTGVPSGTPDETEPEASDIEEQLADEPAEKPEVEEPVDEEPVTDAGKPAKGSRAQKRIQDLVSKVHGLEASLQSQQSELLKQFQTQQAQQQAFWQAQLEEQKRNATLAERQLALLTSRAEAESDAALSPMERYQKRILKEAKETARTELQGELDSLKAMIEEDRRQTATMTKRQQQQASLARYNALTEQAASSVVLKDVDETTRASLGKSSADMLLSFCAATGMEPEAAAPKFAAFLNQYHQARLKSGTKSGAKLKENQQIPQSAPSGRKGGVGTTARPSWDLMKEHGFDSYLEWRKAGAPTLHKRAK